MNTKEFYDALDLAGIMKFIERRQEENLFIDFKTVTDSPLKKNDKRSFAKALSGFANSSGGIIIWGIVAKKKGDEPDVASGTKPIKNIQDMMSQLNSFTGEFVSPIVEGVEHKAILLEESENEGFIATLVPESSKPPHMAKAGIGKYFKRSGESFYSMEHFDLADMFGRRPQPVLKFFMENDSSNSGHFGHIIGIKNIGRGIAKLPYLQIELIGEVFEISEYELDGNGNPGLPIIITSESGPAQRTYGGSANIVVYPNDILRITKIRTKRKDNPVERIKLRIKYKLQCEGITPIENNYDTTVTRNNDPIEMA